MSNKPYDTDRDWCKTHDRCVVDCIADLRAALARARDDLENYKEAHGIACERAEKAGRERDEARGLLDQRFTPEFVAGTVACLDKMATLQRTMEDRDQWKRRGRAAEVEATAQRRLVERAEESLRKSHERFRRLSNLAGSFERRAEKAEREHNALRGAYESARYELQETRTQVETLTRERDEAHHHDGLHRRALSLAIEQRDAERALVEEAGRLLEDAWKRGAFGPSQWDDSVKAWRGKAGL